MRLYTYALLLALIIILTGCGSQNRDSMDTLLNNIRHNSNYIASNTQDDIIKDKSKAIIKDTAKIEKISKQQNKKITKQEEHIKYLKENKSLKTMLNYFILGSLSLSSVGVLLLFFVSFRTGLIFSTFGIINAIMANVFIQYQFLLTLTGLLLFIGGIIYLVYDYLINKKGNKEIIQDVEKLKDVLPDTKDTLKLISQQSANTRKLVDKVKNEIVSESSSG